jgi:hypothetical protein
MDKVGQGLPRHGHDQDLSVGLWKSPRESGGEGVLGPLGRCLRLGCLKHLAESGMESGVEREG